MVADRNLELTSAIMVVVVNYFSKESEIVNVCRFLTRPQAYHELFLCTVTVFPETQ